MKELKDYFITANNDEYIEGEVNVFMQSLNLKNEVKKAVLYITALGLYEVEINGQKVGNQLFAPGLTYYQRDLFYQNYDITQLLNESDNKLKVFLGQGWYSGRFTHENLTKIYGDKTAVSWIIDVTFEDGTSERITSRSNVAELTSKYDYAGFYDGEIYDETLEESEIGSALEYKDKLPENLEETYLPVEKQEEIEIKQVIHKEDHTIIDFGQNFAGFIEIDTKYLKENETIKIRHGELLVSDEELYTENLRKAKAEIIYTSGKEKGIYRPRFTYMGFRYIEISGVDYVDGMVKAFAIYSDMERTGYFESKNDKIQRLFDNQLWGQKSNYIEVPTDCPQRDERQGYTGDGQVFALTGSYNYDTELFWKKFLKDIHYSQLDNSEGYIGATIPANGLTGIGFLSMLGWGNAITIIPEMLYNQYGTDQYLRDYYPNMKKFIDAEIRQLGDDQLWLEPNLGDWLMPGKDVAWMAGNHGPVSNSFIIHDLEVIVGLADKFEFENDKNMYLEQLEKTKNAYIQSFIDENGTILGDYQGAYIMALKYVDLNEELKEKVVNKFVDNVIENGLNTGFFSTEFLLPLLADNGMSKLAYDILLNEECPGWLYQVNKGATTIWERWNAIKEDGSINEESVSLDSGNMVSFNHYAFGSVGEFYYQYILGIKPLEPGYESIVIKPYIDERLMKVSGEFYSRAGKIYSSWEYSNDKIYFNFETPGRTEIELPDGQVYRVESGNYNFEINL